LPATNDALDRIGHGDAPLGDRPHLGQLVGHGHALVTEIVAQPSHRPGVHRERLAAVGQPGHVEVAGHQHRSIPHLLEHSGKRHDVDLLEGSQLGRLGRCVVAVGVRSAVSREVLEGWQNARVRTTLRRMPRRW
jgi:hypothetical protein